MSLVNQNWIGLHGEPVTGRIPPRMLVMNGVQMNPRQMGEVAHHYKLLTYKMHVSIIPYMVQERVLSDGTRVRLVSSYGTDTVMVWPTGGEGRGAASWRFVIKAVRTKGTDSEVNGDPGEFGWYKESEPVTEGQIDGTEYIGSKPGRKLVNAAVTVRIATDSKTGRKKPEVISRGGVVGLGMQGEWSSFFHYGTGVTVVGSYVFIGPDLCAEIPSWPTWGDEQGTVLNFSRPDQENPGDLYVVTTKGVMLWKIPLLGGKLRKFSDEDFIALKESGGLLPQVQTDPALIIRSADYGLGLTIDDAAFMANGSTVAWANYGEELVIGKIRRAATGGYELAEVELGLLAPGRTDSTSHTDTPPIPPPGTSNHGPFTWNEATDAISSSGSVRIATLKGNAVVFSAFSESSSRQYRSGYYYATDIWGGTQIYYAGGPWAGGWGETYLDTNPYSTPEAYDIIQNGTSVTFKLPAAGEQEPSTFRSHWFRKTPLIPGNFAKTDNTVAASATLLGVACSYSQTDTSHYRVYEVDVGDGPSTTYTTDYYGQLTCKSALYANADTGWIVAERFVWREVEGGTNEVPDVVEITYAVDIIKLRGERVSVFTVYEEAYSGGRGMLRFPASRGAFTSLSQQIMGHAPNGLWTHNSLSGWTDPKTGPNPIHCVVSSPECIMFSLVPAVLRQEYRDGSYSFPKQNVDIRPLALAVCDDGAITSLYDLVDIPSLPRQYTALGEGSSAFEMTLLREKI